MQISKFSDHRMLLNKSQVILYTQDIYFEEYLVVSYDR